MSSTQNRVAYVVGGGSGIGEATARSFARRGWRVVIGDRDEVAAVRVADDLGAAEGRAGAVVVDVTDASSVDRATAWVAESFGGLDAIVPCAGMIAPAPSATVDDESLMRMIDVHLVGTIRCLRAAFPYLKESTAGAIVAVSSVAARLGIPERLSYAAAKGGIESVVRTLAVEWAHHGIRVNAVAPGWVRTPMIQHAIDEGRLDVSTLEGLSPFERLADPAEVADAVVFLASPEAGFIAGAVLAVDGALTVKGPWPNGIGPTKTS